MHWHSASADAGSMQMLGLLAKAVGSVAQPAPPAADAGTELLYLLRWQASSPAAGGGSSWPQRQGWSVVDNGSIQLKAAAPAPAPLCDSQFAAGGLAALRQLLELASPDATIALHTVSNSGLAFPGGWSSASATQQRCQSMLWGMLKAVAQEMPERVWAHSSAAEQWTGRAGPLPFHDTHGPGLVAGVAMAPRMLPMAAPTGEAAVMASPAAGVATLITGGTGALGLLLAQQLMMPGDFSISQRVVLLGRSASLTAIDSALGAVIRVARSSVALTIATCDSATAVDVESLAAGLRADGLRLGSIMHAAGVLRDALLPNQTAASLRLALAPKASAAAHVGSRLAGQMPLPILALFSSIASLLGSAGQTNYAAANAALDTFADSWRTQVGFVVDSCQRLAGTISLFKTGVWLPASNSPCHNLPTTGPASCQHCLGCLGWGRHGSGLPCAGRSPAQGGRGCYQPRCWLGRTAACANWEDGRFQWRDHHGSGPGVGPVAGRRPCLQAHLC